MDKVSMVLLTATIVASPAFADSPGLKGEYGYTCSSSCVISPLGFNSQLQAISSNPSFNTGNIEGIRTFNGDGTGTDVNSNQTLTHALSTPGFPPSASSGTGSFS